MKKLLSALIILLLATPVMAGSFDDLTKGYDFYFFGVNTKTFKEANYWKVGAGVVTSIAVHTGGHFLMAEINNVDLRLEGLREVSYGNYNAKQLREVAQGGFVAQNLIGLILTSIPYTRQSDFTKGYVAMAFVETLTYPIIWGQNGNGELNLSDQNGGNRDWEYAGYMAVATHNLLRINWKKD